MTVGPAELADPPGSLLVLRGTVRTPAGAPVSGALIHVVNAGTFSVTGPAGSYRLVLSGLNHANISASAPGHVPIWRTLRLTPGARTRLPLVLAPRAAPVAIAPLEGGVVRAGAVRLSVGPDAFQRVDGEECKDPLMVSLTVLDGMTGDLSAYPALGSEGVSGGEPVMLRPSLVLAIQATDADGAALELRSAASLGLDVPWPSAAGGRPPLWRGLGSRWVEQARESLVAEPGEYRTTLPTLGAWALGPAVVPACVHGRVATPDGGPVPGALIRGVGVDHIAEYLQTSDTSGSFCLPVASAASVELQVLTVGASAIRLTQTSASSPVAGPTCGTAACQEEGDITVDPSAPPALTECEARLAAVPPCLHEYLSVLECMAPEGQCYVVDQERVWDNGAKVAAGELLSPQGVLCASVLSSGPKETRIESTTGTVWVLRFGHRPEWTCQDGETVSVTWKEFGRLVECIAPGAATLCYSEKYAGPCETASDCYFEGQGCCLREKYESEGLVCSTACPP